MVHNVLSVKKKERKKKKNENTKRIPNLWPCSLSVRLLSRKNCMRIVGEIVFAIALILMLAAFIALGFVVMSGDVLLV